MVDVAGKLLWELIEPVNIRMQALHDFLEEVDSTLRYDIVPIYEPYGPTIVDKELKCLYVSEETLKGGRKVNEARAERVSAHFYRLDCMTGHDSPFGQRSAAVCVSIPFGQAKSCVPLDVVL